jgi:CheY-like chemotaxis protein
MPQRNGAEVAGDILSLNPEQKIILASAYALSTERNFSKLKDKVLFLQKPFQLSKILELV